jgi:hypothetical protein
VLAADVTGDWNRITADRDVPEVTPSFAEPAVWVGDIDELWKLPKPSSREA